MKRRTPLIADDRGQTLVWVAVGMIVLLGIVALAVDVGHLYAERRHMQNAADAGALEAARARCYDNDTAAAAAAKGTAFTIAYNSRPDAISQDYEVAVDGTNDWQFIATTTEDTPTYFARVFGISQVEVAATAKAACGPSPQACGIFPLAFNKNIWDGIANQCGQQFYVWNGENSGNSTYVPDCTTLCDCSKVFDNKGDQIPGAIALADVGRAWLDFTAAGTPLNPIDCGGSNGCGTSELACWIKNPSQVLVSENTCVSGTNGVKLGVKNDINDQAGKYFTVPLYGSRCDTSGGSGVCDAQGYNIVSFGCVQVGGLQPQPVSIAWKATPTPDPANPKPSWPKECIKDKMLYVSVACNQCPTDCGKTSSGGNPGAGIKAISLIK
jgi:hypothetical protein